MRYFPQGPLWEGATVAPKAISLALNDSADEHWQARGQLAARAKAVLQGAWKDLGQTGPASLLGRSLRRMPALWLGDAVGRLIHLPIYQAHLEQVGQADPLFFLSHRYYLARGFTLAQRASAAVSHYLSEAALLTPEAAEAIYQGAGLVLWSADHADHRYDIRLTAGLDVAHEGAASLSLYADQTRVCVFSFSHLPRHLVADGPMTADLATLITRKQLTRTRDYQKPFFAAFDRSAPAHLVLAALEGLVQARGGVQLFGLRSGVHPIYSPDIAPHLHAAYCEFWESLSGQISSDRAYALPIPMHLRAIEDLSPDHRARAHARRAHAESIRASARLTMAQHLRKPSAQD